MGDSSSSRSISSSVPPCESSSERLSLFFWSISYLGGCFFSYNFLKNISNSLSSSSLMENWPFLSKAFRSASLLPPSELLEALLFLSWYPELFWSKSPPLDEGYLLDSITLSWSLNLTDFLCAAAIELTGKSSSSSLSLFFADIGSWLAALLKGCSLCVCSIEFSKSFKISSPIPFKTSTSDLIYFLGCSGVGS